MNFSWEPQSFDSEIFGLHTAKISISDRQNETSFSSIGQLIADLKKNKVMYATLRIPAADFSLIHSLERANFFLVDGIIAMERNLEEFRKEQNKKIVRPIRSEWKELLELGRSCFYLNRFYNDSLIKKSMADEVFVRWIENSLLGKAADDVLIFKKEKILGFITLQKSGHIPLVGVAPEARGRGIAKQLVFEGLRIIKQWGKEKSSIETQTINVPAIRSYAACGFKMTNSFLTFRWSPL